MDTQTKANAAGARDRLVRGTAVQWLFAAACAVLALLVCSKSSPLYPINDWVDVHCFFTVGRGMKHGMVPYLDLYEQKGPLLYFLYALCSLVSETSFAGVFALECVCFAAFVYLSGRIGALFAESEGAFWPCACATALLVPISPAFFHGSSCEGTILPLLALGAYVVLGASVRGRILTVRDGIVLGACAACCLWTKYTFCGLFLGLGLVTIVQYVRRGHVRELGMLVAGFVGGMAIVTVSIVAWFAAHGAAGALFQAYFVDNMTSYADPIDGSAFVQIAGCVLVNVTWMVPTVFGIVHLAIRRERHGELALVLGGFMCLLVFTFIGGKYWGYYAYVLCVFQAVGLGAACCWVRRRLTARAGERGGGTSASDRRLAVALAVSTALIPVVGLVLSPNAWMIGKPKDEMPQYQFAKTINASEDQSLLTYGWLDAGFYYAAETLPTNRFFCTLNNPLPQMYEELDQSLREGRTKFVVTFDELPAEFDKYELADKTSAPYEGYTYDYYLYERR